MEINEQGVTLSTLNDILNVSETNLQGTYGTDFFIKPEGVIDNIFTSTAFMELDLQEQIAYLCKQFDPESAEGNWQDALYERIGIYRLAPEPSTFNIQILGLAGFTGSIGDIIIRSDVTQEEFSNTGVYTIDDNGIASVNFACVVAGDTNVSSSETFSIVTAPTQITNTVNDTIENIYIGRNRETDDEFRIRFRGSKSNNAKATQNANISNLTPYVDNIEFLEVLDRKIDNTIPVGTIEVIALPNTTDEIFAEAIFDTIAAGIATQGNTSVNVTDNDGQTVAITFYKADEINIDIQASVKLKTGYYQSNVFSAIKNSIIEYVTKTKIYGLKSTIYATELVIPILAVDGVKAVSDVEIKRSTGATYLQELTMTKYEIPIFTNEGITLNAIT